ncbi:MAG: hypothetical protein HY279_10115 [Nitrospinae bacterium]|nr:hypothetical protein [Nitrospinota bacterium]
MVTKLAEKDALLVKESLEFENSIMELSLVEYKRRLKDFEQKYNMKTKSFLEKFNSGELGDDEEWFDWLFVVKAYNHVKNRIDRIAILVK